VTAGPPEENALPTGGEVFEALRNADPLLGQVAITDDELFLSARDVAAQRQQAALIARLERRLDGGGGGGQGDDDGGAADEGDEEEDAARAAAAPRRGVIGFVKGLFGRGKVAPAPDEVADTDGLIQPVAQEAWAEEGKAPASKARACSCRA
jgi:hypothetical protein